MNIRKCLMLSLFLMYAIFSSQAQLSSYDLNKPFGWAVCASMTTGDDYNLDGGGNEESIVITASGNDMRSTISNAIKNNDVIVLDGSQGDFIVSSTIEMKNLKNKTIVGINNARLCTRFFVTEEIKDALDKAGVKNMSSSSGGGMLSNGEYVSEEREYGTRQTLINLLNDPEEVYRDAGIFYISGCENIIIRNIQFVGPGPIDVGGDDLVSVINGTKHVWIDHCNFTDGIDGNLDVTVKSDFITVSWCAFAYTQRAYGHMYSNLIGGSDDASSQGENNLNVTWANNIWGTGCDQRMPMARFGTIHLYNNYYNCSGNSAGINGRKNSELLIENNYFEKGVKKIFSESDAKAYNWRGNYFAENYSPGEKGIVTVPYQYAAYAATEVPDVLSDANTGAGATLSDPLGIGENNNSDPDDATLKSITVCGITLSVEPDVYDYEVEIPATAVDIVVTTVTSNNRAEVTIEVPSAVDELPATATLTVISQDGTATRTYTVYIIRALSDDTSLAYVMVNGVRATQLSDYVYAYRLPMTATSIDVVVVPGFVGAQVVDVVVPAIEKLPAEAVFTVVAENGDEATYTLLLSRSASQFADGKVWDFTCWSSASCAMLSDNSDVWSPLGDGRYEHTFIEATDLGFDETEGLTFINDVRINPSSSGKGYVQGALSMHIPVIEGQVLAFTFSHTSNSKGTRQLLVNDSSIGATSSTNSTIASYTVPEGVTTLTVRGSEGLRYYKIDMSAAPITDNVHIDAIHTKLVYTGRCIHTDSTERIEIYNMQGICVAVGYNNVDTTHLSAGIYIARCGAETLRVVVR